MTLATFVLGAALEPGGLIAWLIVGLWLPRGVVKESMTR